MYISHSHILINILVLLKWLEIKITKYKQFELIIKHHFDLEYLQVAIYPLYPVINIQTLHTFFHHYPYAV